MCSHQNVSQRQESGGKSVLPLVSALTDTLEKEVFGVSEDL